MLTFGVFLNYTRTYPEEDSVGLFEEFKQLAILSDSLGFDIVWTSEHHMLHMAQGPSALLTAASLAPFVKCRIGTAVSVIPWRHPLVWAGEVAATDNILDGRLEFGVGRGAYKYEFDRFGLELSESKARTEECLEYLRDQWQSDEAVGLEGNFHSFDPAFTWPRPVQHPHPPIWLASNSDESTRWAARSGFNVFHAPFFNTTASIRKLTDAYVDEQQKVGMAESGLRYGALRQGFVVEKESELREKMDLLIQRQRMVDRLADFGSNSDPRGYVRPDPGPNEASPEDIRRNTLMGTVDEVYEKVVEYDEVGVEHLILSFNFGLPMETVADSYRLFAERIMAPYRAEHGAPGSRGAGSDSADRTKAVVET